MVWEGEDVNTKIREDPDTYDVGDRIDYITNNQQGAKQYEVVLDANGLKTAKLVSSYDKEEGGRKRRKTKKRGGKKRKTKKRKTS